MPQGRGEGRPLPPNYPAPALPVLDEEDTYGDYGVEHDCAGPAGPPLPMPKTLRRGASKRRVAEAAPLREGEVRRSGRRHAHGRRRVEQDAERMCADGEEGVRWDEARYDEAQNARRSESDHRAPEHEDEMEAGRRSHSSRRRQQRAWRPREPVEVQRRMRSPLPPPPVLEREAAQCGSGDFLTDSSAEDEALLNSRGASWGDWAGCEEDDVDEAAPAVDVDVGGLFLDDDEDEMVEPTPSESHDRRRRSSSRTRRGEDGEEGRRSRGDVHVRAADLTPRTAARQAAARVAVKVPELSLAYLEELDDRGGTKGLDLPVSGGRIGVNSVGVSRGGGGAGFSTHSTKSWRASLTSPVEPIQPPDTRPGGWASSEQRPGTPLWGNAPDLRGRLVDAGVELVDAGVEEEHFDDTRLTVGDEACDDAASDTTLNDEAFVRVESDTRVLPVPFPEPVAAPSVSAGYGRQVLARDESGFLGVGSATPPRRPPLKSQLKAAAAVQTAAQGAAVAQSAAGLQRYARTPHHPQFVTPRNGRKSRIQLGGQVAPPPRPFANSVALATKPPVIRSRNGGAAPSSDLEYGSFKNTSAAGMGLQPSGRRLQTRVPSGGSAAALGMVRGGSSGKLRFPSVSSPSQQHLMGSRIGSGHGIMRSPSSERILTSEHFSRTGSVGFLGRTESAKLQGGSSPAGLSSSPSIDRMLTSQHFSRNSSVGFIARNESARSSFAASQSPFGESGEGGVNIGGVGSNSGTDIVPFNPANALRVTFVSVNSYGNTELSYDGGDDTMPMPYGGEDVGGTGLLGAAYGHGLSPSFARMNSYQADVPRPAAIQSLVAEAAGSLYRAGSVDERWMFGMMVGEGAFSEVRLGEGRKSGGRVAIKVISKNAADLFGEGGICREVLAFQTIGRHPNVVECLEVCEDELYIYVVLELLTGGLLLPRIADAEHYYPRYNERDAAHVVRSMIKALADCHAIGVAHRDVKPENVLFMCEGMDATIKVTDFGIAHCSDEPCTQMCGTPLYVAPEVMLHKPYGCLADMWSVGVIAHIILVGYPPFDDDDVVQLINKVKFNRVSLDGQEWQITTPEAYDFVSRLLVRNPDHRMSASEALQHPWIVMTSDHSTSAHGEWPRLETAQRNIQQFVVHREFKRVMQHENAASALRLAMLVTLSESNLASIDESFETGDVVADASEAQILSSGKESVNSRYRDDSSWTRPAEAHVRQTDVTGRFEVSQQQQNVSEGSYPQNSGDRWSMHPRVANSAERALERAAERAADMEQVELRRKRLELEERLRRNRVHERDAAGKPPDSCSSTKSRDSTLDSLRTGSPTLQSKEAHAIAQAIAFESEAFDAETSFEERRVADADEDWNYVRQRGGKELGKPARSPKKMRLLRPLVWPKGKPRIPSATEKSAVS